MIFDILEGLIIEKVGLVPGVSLFRNFMPAEAPIGAYFRVPLDGIEVIPEMKDWYVTEIQLISRHTDPVAGAAQAKALKKAVTIESLQVFPATSERGEVHINVFYPKTLPIQFPRLEGNGFEWSQRYFAAFGLKGY